MPLPSHVCHLQVSKSKSGDAGSVEPHCLGEQSVTRVVHAVAVYLCCLRLKLRSGLRLGRRCWAEQLQLCLTLCDLLLEPWFAACLHV